MRPFSTTLYYFFRRNKYFFIGCLAGFILSSIFMPVLEDCHRPSVDSTSAQQKGLRWINRISHYRFPKFNSGDLQLLQQLEQWYFQVQHSDFEPVIVNTSLVDDNISNSKKFNLNSFGKNVALVRDKKLKFYRPRFHHTELKIKNDLLLCVLISEQSLAQSLESEDSPMNQPKLSVVKRIISDYINYTTEALLKDYDIDVYYFYPDIRSENEEVISKNLMVSFNNGRSLESIQTKNGIPKHIEMIRYLIERNKLNEYSFLFLSTDLTLLSVENLLDFILPMSASDCVLSTGNGQPNSSSSDFLRHNFAKNDSILNYGLLISSALLLKCQLDVPCFRAYITNSANNCNACHNAYNLNNIYLSSSSISTQSLTEIKSNWKAISQAVTVYPVARSSQVFHLIHLLIAYHRIPRLSNELLQLEHKIELLTNDTSAHDDTSHDTVSWPPGVFGYQKARTRYEIIRWTFWNATHALMPNEIQVIRPLSQYELEEVNTLKTTCQEWLQNVDTNRLWNVTSIENIYRKFDAVRGLEYIVDLRQSNSVQEKRVRLQVVKPLNPVELMRDMPYVTENMRLTLVLPVRGHLEVPLAIKFLNNYANICLKKSNHQTMLIIALIYTRHLNVTDSIESMLEFEKKEFGRIKKLSLYVQSKFSANSVKIVFLDLHPPDPSGYESKPNTSRFSRFPSEFVYLDLIARSLTASSNEPLLMLHCRTNMLFSMDFLNRVRLNTIAGRQVFLPIPFVEYRLRTSLSNSLFQQNLHQSATNEFFASITELAHKAKNLYFDVRKDNGYFDEANFELVSFYLSDYLHARQMSEKVMPIVRNHQSIVKYQNLYYDSFVDLNHLFGGLDGSSMQLVHMRAVEPELRLFHSSILDSCQHFESNTYSFDSCNHRQLYGLGPKQKLASIVIEFLEIKRRSDPIGP